MLKTDLRPWAYIKINFYTCFCFGRVPDYYGLLFIDFRKNKQKQLCTAFIPEPLVS